MCLGHRTTSEAAFVAYAYEAKVTLLGVSWATLRAYGAVSRETVMEMARGARTALGADVAVSISGIAGPAGGMPNKPVGTTWFGLSTPAEDRAYLFQFEGDRRQNKMQAADAALAPRAGLPPGQSNLKTVVLISADAEWRVAKALFRDSAVLSTQLGEHFEIKKGGLPRQGLPRRLGTCIRGCHNSVCDRQLEAGSTGEPGNLRRV